MVTTVHVPLDDNVYKKIIEAKGEMTWREVLLEWRSSKTEREHPVDKKRF